MVDALLVGARMVPMKVIIIGWVVTFAFMNITFWTTKCIFYAVAIAEKSATVSKGVKLHETFLLGEAHWRLATVAVFSTTPESWVVAARDIAKEI